MSTTKYSSYRQAGYLFPSNGSYIMVVSGDPTITPQAPIVNPVTGVSETPTLVWDNTVVSQTTATSNLPGPASPVGLEHGS
jgi:hypothetical protein